MTTSTLVNNVKVVSLTVGTGTLTLGAPVEGYAGTADLIDGATYSYSVHQDALWEYGRGLWSASAGTLTRGVLKSYDGTVEGTSPVALGPGAAIAVGVLLVEDLSERVGIPANFTINSVTDLPHGTPPYVNISGTSPNFVLDIGLEAGATGPTGATPTFSIGTVTTLAPGSSATATLTGTPPAYVLNLGIPTGATGATGATPVISIGTVTSGTPAVTIGGTALNPVLNFVLQTGATGAAGTPGLNGGQGLPGLSGYVTQTTYAGLSSITPSTGAGTTGFSTGPDAGTHTDANGLTNVPNTGQFAYQASPAGWVRTGSATSPSDPAVLAALAGFPDTDAEYGVPNVTGTAATLTRCAAINTSAGKSGNLDYLDIYVMTVNNGQGVIKISVPNSDGTTVAIVHTVTFGAAPYTAVAATGALRLLAGVHFPANLWVPSGATVWAGGNTSPSNGVILSLDTGTSGFYLAATATGIAVTPTVQAAILRGKFGVANPLAVKSVTDANTVTANQANLFGSSAFTTFHFGPEMQTALSAPLATNHYASSGYPMGFAAYVTGVQVNFNQIGTIQIEFWKPTSATTGVLKAATIVSSGTTNTITGSISGTTLTVTAGTVFLGNTLSGGPTTCVVTDYGTVDGQYVVSVSQTYASGSITVTQTGLQDVFFNADILVEADWVMFFKNLTGLVSRISNNNNPCLFMTSPDYAGAVWTTSNVQYSFRPIIKIPQTAKQLASEQQRKWTLLTRQTFTGTATPTGTPVVGNTTSGSPNLTLTAGVVTVGQIITGTGIPANTTVLSGSPLTNVYVMSANATATNTGITVTPVDWVLSNWTVNDGLISPATGSNTTFARFNYKTASDRRKTMARVVLHTPTAVWGVGYDGSIDTTFYNNGTLAIVDGSAGAGAARLRVAAWNGGSTIPSQTAPKPGKTKSIPIPFTLVADREYTLLMERKRNRTVITFTDTYTTQSAVLDVLSNTVGVTGNNTPNYGLQHGRAGLLYVSGSGVAGDVKCIRFEMLSGVSQSPHAVIMGHSGCDNSQLGDQMSNGYPYQVDDVRGRGDILVSARAGDATTSLMERLALDLNKFTPRYVVIDDAVNFESIGQSQPAGLAAFQANVPQLVAWVQRIGATPIFVTGSPWVTYPAFVASKNAWLRTYCQGNNFTYIDFAKAVSVDNADGAYIPLYDWGDGTHPSFFYGTTREYQACLIDAPELVDLVLAGPTS